MYELEEEWVNMIRIANFWVDPVAISYVPTKVAIPLYKIYYYAG